MQPWWMLVLLLAAWAGRRSCVAGGGKWINSFAGPFVATLGPWTKCSSSKSLHLIDINLRISQFRNRAVEAQTNLQKISGNVTVHVPLTDKGLANMKVASRSNNQWKENAFVFKFPEGPCSAILEYWPDFGRKVYGIDAEQARKDGCIVPKGIYTFDNAPINWTIPKMTVFPYGTWRLEVSFSDFGPDKQPRNIMCFFTECTTIPKL